MSGGEFNIYRYFCLSKFNILFIMRRIFLISAVALALTSCYSSRVIMGNIDRNAPMVEVNKKTNHYLIGGLVPLKNRVDISEHSEYVGDVKNYEIRTEISFVNCLITGLTGWIYCPTQTRYFVPLSEVNSEK